MATDLSLSVSSLSQSRFEASPQLASRGIAESVISSTQKGQSWFKTNKEKLRKFARNRPVKSQSPSRRLLVPPSPLQPRPLPSGGLAANRGSSEMSDSRFLLSSLSEQVEILVGLVASVSAADGAPSFFADSLAQNLGRQAEIFAQTVLQAADKIFRSEVFRAEILRKNLDVEKISLRDLRRLQAQAGALAIPFETEREADSVKQPLWHTPPAVASASAPAPAQTTLHTWMQEIRADISDLRIKLIKSPPDSVPVSPARRSPPSPGRADLELEELQRARERLERQLAEHT